MRIRFPKRPRRRGFLLLEGILALAVFGIAATGFAVALHRAADLAEMTRRRLQITRLLECALIEAVSLPTLEEGKTTVSVAEMAEVQMEIDTLIEPMKEIENEEGNLLQEMYRIEVSAHWFENGQWVEERAETWRYSRMYQSS